jgi:23S rRNA (pseudouridine1915-N3)-methyltransferase
LAERALSRLALIWVGRRAPGPWDDLADEYRSRIARHIPLDEIRVRPIQGRGHDPVRAVAQEGAEILHHIKDGDYVVALDEGGRERTTAALASWLAEHRRLGRVVFVIGGDLGLAEPVKSRAAEILALSQMTLPHLLARVLLLEQLYRAVDLLVGGSYHRGRLEG